MSTKFEIDLETERLLFDGAWLSSEELAGRVTQALAQKNFAGVGRLGEGLEQLAQALAGAKSITIKLSSEAYAKLEAAGQKLGKPATVFARDLLVQVTQGAPMAAAPMTITAAPAAPPVISAPPPVAQSASDVAPEEAAAALTLTPKRRDSAINAPPIMTPVAAPAGPQPNVVVDMSSDDQKSKNPGDARRWFNRT